MFLRWTERVRHALSFRLALWYAVVFVASSTALIAITYVLLAASLRRYDREMIQSTLVQYATAYARGGAAALSILTDTPHFGGSLEDLSAARAACDLPILRKDFIVDPYQLYEAAVNGADAVLLIVRALADAELRSLYEEARGLDLDCLVEVHDASELERALELDADVIGINNRNLDDFNVNIETTVELLTDVPAGKAVVSESGYARREQLDELERIGVDAVLMGETLMRAGDPEALIRDLTLDEEATREHYLERASEGD